MAYKSSNQSKVITINSPMNIIFEVLIKNPTKVARKFMKIALSFKNDLKT